MGRHEDSVMQCVGKGVRDVMWVWKSDGREKENVTLHLGGRKRDL